MSMFFVEHNACVWFSLQLLARAYIIRGLEHLVSVDSKKTFPLSFLRNLYFFLSVFTIDLSEIKTVNQESLLFSL